MNYLSFPRSVLLVQMRGKLQTLFSPTDTITGCNFFLLSVLIGGMAARDAARG
jgi:hypothetical protein